MRVLVFSCFLNFSVKCFMSLPPVTVHAGSVPKIVPGQVFFEEKCSRLPSRWSFHLVKKKRLTRTRSFGTDDVVPMLSTVVLQSEDRRFDLALLAHFDVSLDPKLLP